MLLNDYACDGPDGNTAPIFHRSQFSNLDLNTATPMKRGSSLTQFETSKSHGTESEAAAGFLGQAYKRTIGNVTMAKSFPDSPEVVWILRCHKRSGRGASNISDTGPENIVVGGAVMTLRQSSSSIKCSGEKWFLSAEG